MAIDFPASPTVGQQYTFNNVSYTFTSQGFWAATGGGPALSVSSTFSAPQGRLSITNTAVMAASITNSTTAMYMPYVGDLVPIYNGTSWTMTSLGGFLSTITTDTAKNPSAIGANKVNDWFIWNDAGTLRLCHGPDWTSDTARSVGTNLVAANGLWLNQAAITNACAAQRGTYVGTTRSNASSQLDWIFGALAVGATAGFFGVWNAYNRVVVQSLSADASATWTVASASYAAHSATIRHSFVSGLAEDAFDACYNGIGQASASAFLTFGVGFDSTTAVANSTTGYVGASFSAEGTARMGTTALGFHFVTALEASALGTATVYGNAGQPGGLCQSGLWFNFKM